MSGIMVEPVPGTTGGGAGVTAVTAVSPIQSSGGSSPIISTSLLLPPGAAYDGNGIPISGTYTRQVMMPNGGVITAWTILGNTSGSVSIAVNHSTYAAYPTMTTLFTASCSGAIKAQASGLSFAFSAGDVLQFVATGFSLFTNANIVLTVTPS